MEKFKQLNVWRKAHRLVLEVYRVTKKFPDEERFALVSQMRRAAISVPANIAEGAKRNTTKDRKHFHNISDTSLEELKYYFVLSFDLGYITQEEGEKLTEQAREIGKMLSGLNKKLWCFMAASGSERIWLMAVRLGSPGFRSGCPRT